MTFDNQAGGQLRRSSGTGALQLGGVGTDDQASVNLQNNGTFNVATGTVLFGSAGFAPNVTSSGNFVIGSGALLDYGFGTNTFSGVTVSGAGVLRQSGGSITFAGASTVGPELQLTGGVERELRRVDITA